MGQDEDSPSLSLEFLVEEAMWLEALPPVKALAERGARAALSALPDEALHDLLKVPSALEVGVVLCADERSAELNSAYRGKSGPTNVLSFEGDLEPSPDDPAAALHLGDLVITLGLVQREAKAQGTPLADHFTHLVVHGLLHLCGYDHEDPEEAEEMEALEISILASLSIENPYAERELLLEKTK